MTTDAEKFQALREQLTKLNTSIAQIQGMRREQEAQRDQILNRYGCKNIEELEVKVAEAEKRALAVQDEAEKFIKETAPRVQKIQQALSGTLTEHELGGNP